jgi:phosphate transport system substrate-binding protein
VKPTPDSFAAAAASGDWTHAQDYAVNLIDQPGDDSWPIVSTTFIELPKDPKDPARGLNVIKFFDWAYKNGDPIATQLEYIPLPDAVKNSVRDRWHSDLKGPDGKPIL